MENKMQTNPTRAAGRVLDTGPGRASSWGMDAPVVVMPVLELALQVPAPQRVGGLRDPDGVAPGGVLNRRGWFRVTLRKTSEARRRWGRHTSAAGLPWAPLVRARHSREAGSWVRAGLHR